MDKYPVPEVTASDHLRRLYRFMAARDFVASRQELAEAGYEYTRIDNWLRSGRLIKIVRSVYSYGRDVESAAAVQRTALLVAGPGSAGLLVARAPYALVDYSTEASNRQLRFAFLEACRLRLFDRPDLEYCHTRLFHRRGVAKLRQFLVLWVPELRRIKSVLEGWFLLVWIERGYPLPKVNERVFGFEVDAFWPGRLYALELDGDAFHTDPPQRALDREKQRVLESHGLKVNRLTYREFAADPVGHVDRIAHQMGYTRARR